MKSSRLGFLCLSIFALVTAACGDSGSSGGERCGNGIVETDETCDDLNTWSLDGCSETCQQEEGWLCESEPSVCEPVCGDGLIVWTELCDDGNIQTGDGCGADCQIEEGWYCDGDEPSICVTFCGDEMAVGEEECDAADLGGETCAGLGLQGGTLACLTDCLYDVSGCDVVADCGNDAREYPEQCDGNDLAGQTCVTLGYGAGTLVCADNCTFDVSGCGAGPNCGNDVQEQGEQCDGTDLAGQTCVTLGYASGTLDCTIGCTFDVSGCAGTHCGNGTLDTGEECDGTDFGTATCVSLGHDGGDLICTNDCHIDDSMCADCPEGWDYCLGACVDTLSDPANCNGCGNACGNNEICVGGNCKDLNLDWIYVGNNPVSSNEGARAHDMATEGTAPAVAWVTPNDAGIISEVRVAQYNGTAQWQELTPPPSQGGAIMPDPVVAIQFAGTVPYVLMSGMSTSSTNINLVRRQGSSWQQVGAPGYATNYQTLTFMDMVMDGTAPHITTYGAGGLGSGIEYFWFDGTDWQSHPNGGVDGIITYSGNGNPAVVVTDQPYVAVPDQSSMPPIVSQHRVVYWDINAAGWTALGGVLDENADTAPNENTAMAADLYGNLYVAWAEAVANTDPPTYTIYVKKYSVASGSWTLLGGGAAVDPGNANQPSITIIGDAPWLAYVNSELTSMIDMVLVRRYNSQTDTWQQVGNALNDTSFPNFGRAPVIIGIGGVPYVAFRQLRPDTMEEVLNVKFYVLVTAPPIISE